MGQLGQQCFTATEKSMESWVETKNLAFYNKSNTST